MKSPRKSHKQQSFARKVLINVSGEAASLLPFVLLAYAVVFGLHAAGRFPLEGIAWSAVHGFVAFLLLLSLPALLQRGESRELLLTKIASARAKLGRWSWKQYGKVLLCVALLSVATRYGAGALGLLMLAFACAALFFSVIGERTVYILTAVLLAAVPVFQAAGQQSMADGFAVCAFEVLSVAVAVSASKNLSTV